MSLNDLQDALGVKFRDTSLLEQALTHSSFLNEHPGEDLADYERLEFLGDAILEFVTGEMLFRRFPELDEGELTRLRSALVRTEALAELARTVNLGEYLRMGRGEVRNGGRGRVSTLCRAFEAVVGAVYIDLGIEAVRELVIPRLTALQHRVIQDALNKDARTRLQEWSQAELDVAPSFEVISVTGPDHDRQYLVEVRLNGIAIANGTGKTIRAAGKEGAATALRSLEVGGIDIERLRRPRD
ncbi:MAG: ribonuclease III [Chloroflexi bacterium]|nr:ribonuclease III [Chloroflexota bacterium]